MMRCGVILLLLFSFIGISFAENLYEFDDKRQLAQFQSLLINLRCPVCQNQDLSDSNAPIAKDLRSEVYKLVKLGKSDTEIIIHLTDRFGDFILFKPKFKSITVFLWLGPILFALIGVMIFYFSVNRKYDGQL